MMPSSNTPNVSKQFYCISSAPCCLFLTCAYICHPPFPTYCLNQIILTWTSHSGSNIVKVILFYCFEKKKQPIFFSPNVVPLVNLHLSEDVLSIKIETCLCLHNFFSFGAFFYLEYILQFYIVKLTIFILPSIILIIFVESP